MLKIEIRKPSDGICSEGDGSGVVISRPGVLRVELGRFCSECPKGAARWEATLKLIADAEPVPPPPSDDGPKEPAPHRVLNIFGRGEFTWLR